MTMYDVNLHFKNYYFGFLCCILGYFGYFAVSVVPAAGISDARGAGADATDEGGTHSGSGRQ